jgi:hypothetical protein
MKNPKKAKKCKNCNKDIINPLNIKQLGAARFCSLDCLFLFQKPKVTKKPIVKQVTKVLKSGTSSKSTKHFTIDSTSKTNIELNKVENKEIFDRDAKYLNFIRKQKCVVSKGCDGPINAHHVIPGGQGLKCSDYLTIPLCNGHHTGFTNCVHKLSKTDFESSHNVDINKAVTNNLINYLRSLKNV